MLIDKYVLYFEQAVEKVSHRFDLPPLTRSQLFVLYAVKRSHIAPYAEQVRRIVKAAGFRISDGSMHRALGDLVNLGLLIRTDSRYSLSPMGRDYISSVRKYLLNKRL